MIHQMDLPTPNVDPPVTVLANYNQGIERFRIGRETVRDAGDLTQKR